MKCEICHEHDAETAIVRVENGEEQELYVCHACADRERVRRQKKSQRTRKLNGLPPGVAISVTGVGGDVPPGAPILEAIMNAVNGMVSGMERPPAEPKQPQLIELPVGRADGVYRIGSLLHLEGIHLIGELEAVQRSMRALGYELTGVTADGVHDTGHAYRFRYHGSTERACRVFEDLLAQERNARVRLVEELPRIFGDAICRALAILKNCRLLSSGELFDLMSPLRLAAIENLLDGVTRAEIEKLMVEIDLTSKEDRESPIDRDKIDAERADAMNRRFEDVILNERAEGRFL